MGMDERRKKRRKLRIEGRWMKGKEGRSMESNKERRKERQVDIKEWRMHEQGELL